MVIIARVEIRSVIEQKLCGRDVGGEMKRRAAIAAFGFDQLGILVEQVGKHVCETKSSGGMDAERGATVH